MGRMKVYGGSWDLPEACPLEHPFKDYLVVQEEDHVTPSFMPEMREKSPTEVYLPEARQPATAS